MVFPSRRIFPFVAIHTVKSFSIVSYSEVDDFLKLPCFLCDPTNVVPLLFLNPACTSACYQFTYCWSLAWRILSITLLACEMSAIVWWFEYSLASLWDWNENRSFPVLWPLLSFPNLLAYWVVLYWFGQNVPLVFK